MAKLKILTESSLEGQNMYLTHYKQFLDKINAWNDGLFCYHDVKLSKCSNTENTVSAFYGDCITWIPENVERRFKNLNNIACIFESGIFAEYIDLDDSWQKFSHVWRKPNLIKHFNDILLSNSCDNYQVQTEWDRLR